VKPPAPAAKAEDSGPMFHGLFRSSGDGEPIAPVVNALWGTPPATATTAPPSAGTPATAYAPAAPEPRRPQPLDLFQDQLPDARALFRGRV
jgi:hypothetical protein